MAKTTAPKSIYVVSVELMSFIISPTSFFIVLFWWPGFSLEEFIEIHVCLFPRGMLPLCAFWVGGSSWVRFPFILLWSTTMLMKLRTLLLLNFNRKGQALQFNWLFEKGGFILHPDETFSVDFAKVSVAALLFYR